MGYREHILLLLKTGRMIKLKGQGLAVPHMKLHNNHSIRSSGTISKRSIVDQVSLPHRLSSLKLGGAVVRKKIGGRLKKISRKSSRKTSRKASKKSSKKSTGGKIRRKISKKISRRKSTGGKIRRKKASKKSTGGKIRSKKASKKQSFKALKFNF